MLTLLNEVHFWTLKDDVDVSQTDFGVFRYHDKKSAGDTAFSEGKKNYAEKRGMHWILSNKRPHKLKDLLRELEECLCQQRIVLSQWRDSALLQIVFSSGLLVNIFVNVHTGDVLNIVFDKFLVGKLPSDSIVSVVLTKCHLICAYNDNQLTLVYFTKPALKRAAPKSLNRLDPRIQTLELPGPPGRRLERKIVTNVSGDMILVWWQSCQDEVFPWSPHFKEEDRANILIYGISGVKSELLCHHKSEHDPLSVTFSHIHSNILHCVEQKVSRKGEVTVENAVYEISRSGLHRLSLSSIPLPTHICCHGFNSGQDKLLIGCVDGSLVLFDHGCGVTHTVKAAFTPSLISWHPGGAVVFVANERAQLQVMDATLSCIRQQSLGEDGAPSNILDLATYLRGQPTLQKLLWAKQADAMVVHVEKYAPMDSLLLLVLERGPLAVVRLVGGGGIVGDVHGGGGLTIDSLVAQYLWVNQVDRAINLLQALNWDLHGSDCLSALYRIAIYLFKRPLTPQREDQLQNALGTFHLPVRPMCPATVEEFAASVKDLTRRFFHHLLRYHLFEKAFRLAIDLRCRDLFLDIHFSARQAGQMDLATAAYNKAEELDKIDDSEDSISSHSVCSRSSCSVCSSGESRSSSVGNDKEDNLLPRKDSLRSSLHQRRRRRPIGRSGSDAGSARTSGRKRRADAATVLAATAANIPDTFAMTVATTPSSIATATNVTVDPATAGLNHYEKATLKLASVSQTPATTDQLLDGNPDAPCADGFLDHNLNPVNRVGSLTVCDFPTTSNQQQQHLRQILLNHLNNYQPVTTTATVLPVSSTPPLQLSNSSSMPSKIDVVGLTTATTPTTPWHNVFTEPSTSRPPEKPKVKFNDTVMQITVPERLDTVLEETEDQLPYRSLPNYLNSFHGSLKPPSGTNIAPSYFNKTLSSQNYQPETTTSVFSTFPSHRMSLPAPNVIPNSASESVRKSIESPSSQPVSTCPTLQWVVNEPSNDIFRNSSSHVTSSASNPRLPVPVPDVWSGYYNKPVLNPSYDSSSHQPLNLSNARSKSFSFDDMTINERLTQLSLSNQPCNWTGVPFRELDSVTGRSPNVPQTLPNVCASSGSQTFWQSNEVRSNIDQSWPMGVSDDPLDSNNSLEMDLSSLLPGSRKSVAPSSNDLPPVSLALKPPVPPSLADNDPSHLIKYMSLADLSEEEENNGTIKVVHFGVV